MKEYIMKTEDNGWVSSVVCEVVRCKDCKYYHKPEYGFTYGDCTYCSAWRQVSTDDFCSKGRRKDT